MVYDLIRQQHFFHMPSGGSTLAHTTPLECSVLLYLDSVSVRGLDANPTAARHAEAWRPRPWCWCLSARLQVYFRRRRLVLPASQWLVLEDLLFIEGHTIKDDYTFLQMLYCRFCLSNYLEKALFRLPLVLVVLICQVLQW